MKIWIDADGCPVVKEAVAIAQEHDIPVCIVKNASVELHFVNAEVITVDSSKDSADFFIFTKMKEGDIVVTQDGGLSAMVLSKKGIPIDQHGKTLKKEEADFLLHGRHVKKMERLKNKRYENIRKRRKEDTLRFVNSLRTLLLTHSHSK